MTEEVPKNHGFLKFIVIFMGILIMLGLAGVVWKMVDLAKSKAARQKHEAARLEKPVGPEKPEMPFSFDLTMESDERILEMSGAAGGLWLRIGRGGVTRRIILIDRQGNITGNIGVGHEDAEPAR